MNNKIYIAPSILSGDFVNMSKSIQQLEDWGGDYVHCDVMDGVYVKNITFGMPMVAGIRKITQKVLDVHLMITKPENYVVAFAEAGADIITFHPEASSDPLATLKMIKNCGKKCGIVFNPDVDIDKFKYLFSECDVILVMTVFAGLGGQKFIMNCLDRIKKIVSILKDIGKDIPIEVDGGINITTAPLAIDAGATILVAGSAVYKAENPTEIIKKLKGTK
ncbi:MAG: ribulose-phosphate 3-epimerase [Clostridia bacterium]